MRVIAHEPHAWFLYEEGESLYLDVNCSNGPVGFCVLLRLTPQEQRLFQAEGAGAVDGLAAAIRGQAGSIRHSRNLDPTWHAKAARAAAEWQAGRGAGQG